ncbi:hypothetical protein ABIB66_008022 [Bradyrhizobium sp. F1.13.3]
MPHSWVAVASDRCHCREHGRPHVGAVCERLVAASRPVVIDYSAYLIRCAASVRLKPSSNVRLALDDPNIDALDQVRTVWCNPLAFAHRETEDHERRRNLDIPMRILLDGLPGALTAAHGLVQRLARRPCGRPQSVAAARRNRAGVRHSRHAGLLLGRGGRRLRATAGKLSSRASAARADTGVRLPSTPRMRSRRYGKTAAMLAGTQTLVTINDDNFSLEGKGFHELLRRMGDEGYEAISFWAENADGDPRKPRHVAAGHATDTPRRTMSTRLSFGVFGRRPYRRVSKTPCQQHHCRRGTKYWP